MKRRHYHKPRNRGRVHRPISASSPSRRRSARVRAQWLSWILVVCVASAGIYWLLRPILMTTPSPPSPWGLWLSTDAESTRGQPDHEPDWLLVLRIEAPRGCSGPATVVGALQWRLKEVGVNYNVTPPTRLMLAVAGVRVLAVEMSSPEPVGAYARHLKWQSVHVNHVEGAYVAYNTVSNWATPDQAAEFRLKLKAASSAGYGECYVTSPTLIDAQHEGVVEGEQEAWHNLSEYIPLYVQGHNLDENLETTLALDAVVRMSVPHLEPDRAALDAGAHVQQGSVILTCTTREPPSSEATDDRYYDYLRHLGERFCASIQTFRARNTSAKLAVRNTIASVLVGLVGSILVLALTGRWWQQRLDRMMRVLTSIGKIN
jgi:hypothetical protein